MKLGIFGGSFNPVHAGHIRLAETALSELNLDKVIFVPSYRTPLKKEIVFLPPRERLRLLKTTLATYPHFEVSTWEMRQGRMVYTVETLRYFKKKYGSKAMLYFLAGADNLKNLSRWKSLDSVLKLCRFCVFSRPGHPLKKGISDKLLWVPMEALDVSSTKLRRIARTKGDVSSILKRK